MSGDDYIKKIDQNKKALHALSKDINYRDQQAKRNQPTYSIDAQIKGQFVKINEQIDTIQLMYNNSQAKAKQLGLLQRDLQKRKQLLDSNRKERDKLKNLYDQSLFTKIPNSNAAKQQQNMEKFQKAYENKQMNKQQLLKIKSQQEKKQDQALDGLIGVIGQIKTGQKQIKEQLVEQDVMLDKLQNNMDENIENMSKIRKNMTKLLQNSSYCCLIIVILIEIVAIVCNLVLWPKK